MIIIVFSITEAVRFRLFVNRLPHDFSELIIIALKRSPEIRSVIKAQAWFELPLRGQAYPGAMLAELTVDGGMSCQLYPRVLNELLRKEQENNDV